jgi:hypothetical protein
MNTNPKIIINSAPGKNPEDTDGNDLLECYFQRTEHGNGTYHLHGKDGEKIKTEPHHFKNGEGFTFKLGELEWSVTKLSIWSIEEDPPIWFATGDWKAGDKIAEDDPETGTFQGQSGGGPEYAATESASA